MNVDVDAKLKSIGIDATALFEKAMLNDYYGRHLLPSTEEENYLYPLDAQERQVWIVKDRSREHPFKVRVIEAHDSLIAQQPVAELVWLNESVYLMDNLLEDKSVQKIQRKLEAGGKALAQIANSAVISVLRNSTGHRSPVRPNSFSELKQFITTRFSDAAKERGYRLDRLVFSDHLEPYLTGNGFVKKGNKFANPQYAGETDTGQSAFRSSELPANSAVLFSQDAGMVLRKEELIEIWVGKHNHPNYGPIPTVVGTIAINPIIKHTQDVFMIEGIEGAFGAEEQTVMVTSSGGASGFFDRIKHEVEKSVIEDEFKKVALFDLEEASLAYSAQAYKACIVMLGATLEGIMLATIRRNEILDALIDAGDQAPQCFRQLRPTAVSKSALARRVADKLGFDEYNQIIRHLIPYIDELEAQKIQVFRNTVHPWKGVDRPEVYREPDEASAMKHLSSLVKLAKVILTVSPR